MPPNRVRARHLGITCVAVGALLAGACRATGPTHDEIAPAVYGAAIDSLFARDTTSTSRINTVLGLEPPPPGDGAQQPVLVERTTIDPFPWIAMVAPEPSTDSVTAARRELKRRNVPQELADAFVAANRQRDSVRLPRTARLPLRFDTLSAAWRARLDTLRTAYWRSGASGKEIIAAFPDETRIWLSRVGVSRDGRRALVYVATRCGSLCGEGVIVRLSRDGERWRVVELVRLWVS